MCLLTGRVSSVSCPWGPRSRNGAGPQAGRASRAGAAGSSRSPGAGSVPAARGGLGGAHGQPAPAPVKAVEAVGGLCRGNQRENLNKFE